MRNHTSFMPVVRTPEFIFDDTIARFWFAHNPVMTHGFNAFNLVIPEFERYFVRSVHRFVPSIQDPQLLDQVHGFTKQEVQHARVHEQYFDWMRDQGYKIDRYLALLAKYARWSERMNTARYNLASTAAAEHLTAIIGVLFLTEPGLDAGMHPVMKRFLTWHSVEEIEHKAVAYDVMRQAGTGYFMRIFVYTLTLLEMFVWIHAAIYMLARQDKLSLLAMYRYKRRYKKNMQGVSRRFLKYLFAYYRPGFHPCQDLPVTNLQECLHRAGVQSS